MLRYPIEPVPEPRQNLRSKYNPKISKGKKRAIEKYEVFKLKCQLANMKIPLANAHFIFILPMAKGWSEKQKAEMVGKPHQSKNGPDLDNLIKALLDANFRNDAEVYDYRATKIWGLEGAICIGRCDSIEII